MRQVCRTADLAGQKTTRYKRIGRGGGRNNQMINAEDLYPLSLGKLAGRFPQFRGHVYSFVVVRFQIFGRCNLLLEFLYFYR